MMLTLRLISFFPVRKEMGVFLFCVYQIAGFTFTLKITVRKFYASVCCLYRWLSPSSVV